MNEYPDNELINMISENSEEARDLIFEKYSYIIDIVIAKYKNVINGLSIDLDEIRQEAMVGLSDALVCYNQDEAANLATFITLCSERRIQNYVKKFTTQKEIANRGVISIDQKNINNLSLEETIGDLRDEPLKMLEEEEDFKRLQNKIDEMLSPAEKDVYKLLIKNYKDEDIAKILNLNIKQVYNTTHRIRNKIKDIL